MNNNRQPNNNRRRGRNNSNRQQNNNRSGFDYQNNIDNRARGNASQMLEKYKKLAADALHNDDRVNAEYYHQFADHYFRVLADFRARQEAKQEDRRPQRDENRDDADDNSNSQSESQEDNSGSDETDAEERPQRRQRKPRAEKPANRERKESAESNEQGGLDLAVLPPAISVSGDSSDDAPAKAKPVRKPRTAKPKLVTEDTSIATAAE